MSGFTPEHLPPPWPTPPRAPDPPPDTSEQYPDEDPERIAQWGVGQHHSLFTAITGENLPPTNSLGRFGTLPGPDHHPLAVPAAWIGCAAIVSSLLGVLTIIFATMAVTHASDDEVLPQVDVALGVVLLIGGLAMWI
ncbi:MAG: hypothetical protein FWF75_08095 [Propionibacteriaceae bacterium]|nr:hypothetical protein [Propionibacteriaceae bacterium]